MRVARTQTRAVQLALVLAACLALGACGGSPGAAPATETPVADQLPASVPTSPATTPYAKFSAETPLAVTSGPGVISVMSDAGEDDGGRIITVDALTGKKKWSAPTGNKGFLASDVSGPGTTTGGAIVAADDVSVPQAGLDPSSIRTDVVAREADDGTERWRVEVLRQPVDRPDEQRERLVGLVVQGDTVLVATTWTLRVLETSTGRQRWSVSLKPPSADADTSTLGWRSVDLGPGDVAGSAALDGDSGSLFDFDLTTGKTRWRLSRPITADGSAPPFGQVAVGANRVLAETSQSSADQSVTESLTALTLQSGKVAWESARTPIADPIPFRLDYDDGTVIRAPQTGLLALNMQSGAVRWKQPEGVAPEVVAVLDGMTYFIGVSGDDRQVVAVRTRTGEQTAVLPAPDAVTVAVFVGVVAIVFDGSVQLFR